MIYKLTVDVSRNVVEQYTITVEATDPEEAQDLAYEYFVDYPKGQDFLKTRMRTKEDTTSTEVLSVEFEREKGLLQDDLATGVFGEDN